MNRPALIGVSVGCLVLAASCVMVMDPERPGAWAPSGEYRKTVEFPAGSTLLLEFGAGEMEITGGEEEVLEVVAWDRRRFPEEGRGIRAYGFWTTKPAIDVQRTADGYRVQARSSDDPSRPTNLGIRIRVPHSVLLEEIRVEDGTVSVADIYGRMAISLGTGDVTVRNYSGPLDIGVGSGTVDVEVLDVRDGDLIGITTGTGDIVLRLEAGTGARIEARAPNGAVRSEFDLGVPLPAPEVSGQMGPGGASVVLENREGDIDILIVKEVMKNHG